MNKYNNNINIYLVLSDMCLYTSLKVIKQQKRVFWTHVFYLCTFTPFIYLIQILVIFNA